MAIVQFDVRNDELAVGGVEPRKCRVIARVVIDLDRSIERRRRDIRQRDGQGLRRPATCKSTMFIADAVADGGAKVGAEGVVTVEVERVEPSDRPEHHVVDEIGCVRMGTGPPRESTVCPAMMWWQEATDELGEGASIAAAIAQQETPGRAIERRRRGGHAKPAGADATPLDKNIYFLNRSQNVNVTGW